MSQRVCGEGACVCDCALWKNRLPSKPQLTTNLSRNDQVFVQGYSSNIVRCIMLIVNSSLHGPLRNSSIRAGLPGEQGQWSGKDIHDKAGKEEDEKRRVKENKKKKLQRQCMQEMRGVGKLLIPNFKLVGLLPALIQISCCHLCPQESTHTLGPPKTN